MFVERNSGPRKFIQSNLILFAFIASLVSCGGASAPSPENLLGGGLSEGEVRKLSFNQQNQAQVSFSELSGEEQFALIFFGANLDQGAFNIQFQSLDTSAGTRFLSMSPAAEKPIELDAADDPTAAAHEKLREAEQAFDGLEPYHPGAGVFTGSKNLAVDTTCGDGGIQIKVLQSLDNTDNFSTTCAIPIRQTENANYFVDAEALNLLPASMTNPIIDDFEAKIAEEHALIGHESDVDQDGKINVYFTPAVNALGQNSGGFVTGFFFGGDLFPTNVAPSSNQREILYSLVPDPDGRYGTPLSPEFWSSNIGPTILTHEFQHMINYNYKAIQHQIGGEEAWMNEGLSHFLEDLQKDAGGDLNHLAFNGVSAENPSRVSIYLKSPNTPFTGGTSLAQRGGAYLAFRYLCEQSNLGRYPKVANCQELLQGLVQSDQKGVANIEAITGISFQDFLLDFYVTLQLSNQGINSDPRYNFLGINLNSEQNDHRGTVLKGVTGQSLNSLSTEGTVNSPGGAFYDIDGKTISQAGQALSFIASPGMIPGGAVIRLR